MKEFVTNREYKITNAKWEKNTLNVFFQKNEKKYILPINFKDQYARNSKGNICKNQEELDFCIDITLTKEIDNSGKQLYIEDSFPSIYSTDVIQFCIENEIFKIIKNPIPVICWYEKTNKREENGNSYSILEKSEYTPPVEKLKNLNILDWWEEKSCSSGSDRFYTLEYIIITEDKNKNTIQKNKLLVKDYYTEMWQNGGNSWSHQPSNNYEKYCFSVLSFLKKKAKKAKTVYDYKRINHIFKRHGQVFTEIYDYNIEAEEKTANKRKIYAENVIKELKEEVGKEKVEKVLKKNKFKIAEIKFFTELHRYIRENYISKKQIEKAFECGWRHFYNILGEGTPVYGNFNYTYATYYNYIEYFM